MCEFMIYENGAVEDQNKLLSDRVCGFWLLEITLGLGPAGELSNHGKIMRGE